MCAYMQYYSIWLEYGFQQMHDIAVYCNIHCVAHWQTCYVFTA